jgi:hypothetical protein
MPGLFCDTLHRLSPQVVPAGKAVFFGEPIGAHKKLVRKKVFRAFYGNGANHHLGLALVVTAQEDNLDMEGMAHMVGDKGGVGNYRNIPLGIGQLFRQEGAAGAGFDNHRFPVRHGPGRGLGYPLLYLVMEGQAAPHIVHGAHERKAVFPAENPHFLKLRQILPYRYLGYPQKFRQNIYLKLLPLADYIEDFCVPLYHFRCSLWGYAMLLFFLCQ